MKITKHAQSCIILESNGSRIIVDPGKFIVEKEKLDTEKFGNFDGILITHGHPDHMSPEIIKTILKNDGVKVFLNNDSAENLKDISKPFEIIQDNGQVQIGNFKITATNLNHFKIPMEPPKLTGYLVNDGKTSVLLAGDCVELSENLEAEVVFVPMSGPLGVDLDKAKESLLKVKPKIAIPVHNDSPTNRKEGLEESFKEMMSDTDIEVKILKNGETIEVNPNH